MNNLYRICKILTLFAVAYLLPALKTNAQQLGSGDQAKFGTTVAQFLGIGMGSRAMGMGGAFVGLSDDISALYWNPAGVANHSKIQVAFSHTRWLIDTRLNWAAATVPAGYLGVFGVAVTNLDYGTMEETTFSQEDGTGRTFSASDLAVQLSWAKALTDRFSIGISLKYVGQSIWTASSQGAAVDVGVLFNTGLLPNGLRVGASIANYGTQMRLDGPLLTRNFDPSNGQSNGSNRNVPVRLVTEEFSMPLIYRLGLSYDLIRSAESKFTLVGDAVNTNDNVVTLNFGSEYGWKNIFFLRAGYNALLERESEKGLTLGVGLRYPIGTMAFKFDYTFQTFGRLNAPQWLAINLEF
jgi:Uncharacterised protein family (UPF0164)